jgi:hypothetical protein
VGTLRRRRIRYACDRLGLHAVVAGPFMARCWQAVGCQYLLADYWGILLFLAYDDFFSSAKLTPSRAEPFSQTITAAGFLQHGSLNRSNSTKACSRKVVKQCRSW